MSHHASLKKEKNCNAPSSPVPQRGLSHLTSLLSSYNPYSKEEALTKSYFLRCLEKYEMDILTRNRDAHITVSSIVLNVSFDKMLMVYHNIYDSLSWTGGHADGDMDFLGVALKETREETGVTTLSCPYPFILSLDTLPVKAHCKNGKKVDAHVHLNITYALLADEREKICPNPDENSSVCWVDISQLEDVCKEKGMLPLYQKLIKRAKDNMTCYPAQRKDVLSKIVSPLLSWYDRHARILPWREKNDPYEIWISEIMLQQTRVETVKGYFDRFISALDSPARLAQADDDLLLKLWEGLGYYNRVKNLKKAAAIMVSDYGGNLPRSYDALLRLPGIGPYTAGAVCSIAYGMKTPAVDGNVLRVLSRLSADPSDILHPAVRKRAEKNLAAVYPDDRCADFTQALMELGALVCVPNGAPECPNCPLFSLCTAGKEKSASLYPVKKSKKARKKENLTVFLLRSHGKLALSRRGEKGVLSGQWELPNTIGHLSDNQALSYVKDLELRPSSILKRFEAKHIFTHIEWNMLVYEITAERQSPSFTWVSDSELYHTVALPTAFKKLLR